ncbi:MAG: hypothetical protein J2P35_02275 [Actinobacteria bacterium]|nr:hypothetical protein [Actinomycetota bacterium]MBO0785815.1 hypothetical protein [Actinomycetota bacterium]
MEPQGRAWIEQLPSELDGQRAILQRLLAACDADARIRWLLIGCSLARGAGDRLSDLDLAMGVREEEFDAALAAVRRTVDRLADLVDSYQHQLPGVTARHQRIFAQYGNRCQVDLVVFGASEPMGGVPNAVVLYDPDQRITRPAGQAPPGQAPAGQAAPGPEQVREWAFHGWCALADLGKYLRRGSAWEALGRLHEARGQLWQLLAAAHDVPQPQYGLTSILDFAPDKVPPELAGTVSGLEPAGLLAAARRVAELLASAGKLLRPELAAMLPDAMARYVTADLAAL